MSKSKHWAGANNARLGTFIVSVEEMEMGHWSGGPRTIMQLFSNKDLPKPITEAVQIYIASQIYNSTSLQDYLDSIFKDVDINLL